MTWQTAESPIGNPKLEYLPRHAEEIQAELRGMVEKWKAAGCPRDTQVRHPFSEWASVIGGILKVNGFRGFPRQLRDPPIGRRSAP